MVKVKLPNVKAQLAALPAKVARAVSTVKLNFVEWQECKTAAQGQITLSDAYAIIDRAMSADVLPQQTKALTLQVNLFTVRSTRDAQIKPALVTEDRPNREVTAGPMLGGTMFINGVSGDDPTQLDAGDCFTVAPMSAASQTNPQAIKDAFRTNADCTLSVRKKVCHAEKPVGRVRAPR